MFGSDIELFNLDYALDNIRKDRVFKIMENTLNFAYSEFTDEEYLLVLCEMYKIIDRSLLITYLNKDVDSGFKVVSMNNEIIRRKMKEFP